MWRDHRRSPGAPSCQTGGHRSKGHGVGHDSGRSTSIQVGCIVLAARQVHRSNRMASIPVGARGSVTLVVTAEHLANRFKDATLPPVLATPVMIMAMENAALNAIKPYLGAQESALGTRIDVRHLMATPAGRRVTGEAEVTRVDGRRIEFSVSATDAAERIGTGTHERIVIDSAKFVARMKAKFA